MASNFPTIMGQLRARVQSHVVSLWAGKPLLVSWPNVKFNPPGDVDPTADNVTHELDVWLRVSINPGAAFQREIGSTGNNLHRATGVMTLGIFERSGIGTAKTETLTKLALDALRSYGTSLLQIGSEANDSPYPHVVGNVGAWFQTNVVCPFYYNEFA